MPYKTRKNKYKLGGGLFNYFKRRFTRTKQPPPLLRNTRYPPRGYSVQQPKSFQTEMSISPIENNSQNQKLVFSKYESYRDASNRMFAFVYQMYKQKDLPLKERVYKDDFVELSPAQLKELKKAFINAMYVNGKFSPGYNETQLDEINMKLFGLKNQDELGRFQDYYLEIESQSPKAGPSAGLEPLKPFSFIARLIPALLKTEREFDYTSNQEEYICTPTDLAKNNARTLNSSECVLLTRSIPALYKNITYNFLLTNAFYMVVSPQYFPVGGETFQSKYFDTRVNSTTNITVSITMKYLHKVSFIQDAFKNGAIELFHPRLGLLIQEQKPELWDASYYNTKNSVRTDGKKLDLVDRVVILTLQKYAAIRRYMWTKDPRLTAQVYQINPLGIASELRDPYSVLPPKVISNQNKQSSMYNVLQKIPSYSSFNEKLFLKEFYDNQKWAANSNKIKYKSPNDPAIDKILPKNFWALPGPYKETEQVEIAVLPELEEVNISRKYSNMNNSRR